MVSSDAPTMVGFRPQESEVNAPIAEPMGAPMEMIRDELKDWAMVRPLCTKKVGSQVTKPKIRVFTVIRVMQPTIMRGKRAGVRRELRLLDGTLAGVGDGGGSGPCCLETSFSMDCRRVSASS